MFVNKQFNATYLEQFFHWIRVWPQDHERRLIKCQCFVIYPSQTVVFLPPLCQCVICFSFRVCGFGRGFGEKRLSQKPTACSNKHKPQAQPPQHHPILTWTRGKRRRRCQHINKTLPLPWTNSCPLITSTKKPTDRTHWSPVTSWSALIPHRGNDLKHIPIFEKSKNRVLEAIPRLWEIMKPKIGLFLAGRGQRN